MKIDVDWRGKLVSSLEQASRGPLRKKTACLRDIYEQVLAAKASDLSEKVIIQILAQQGLHFSRSSFAVTMHRLKREREDATSGRRNRAKPDRVAPGPPKVTTSPADSQTSPITKERQVKSRSAKKPGQATPEKLSGIMRDKFDLSKYRNND